MEYPEHIFKAYDVRGVYPKDLNESVVQSIAESLARYFISLKKPNQKRVRVILGYDARLSSKKLYKKALTGLSQKYVRVIEADLITTPMLYFLVNDMKADGGVMITASHNPKDYNGLKVVGRNAVPIGGREIYLMTTSGISV